LILVDSSVWIDFFSSSPGRAGAELRRMIEEDEPFALTGAVISEVLQGITRDPAQIERFLAQWDFVEPEGFSTWCKAAEIFRAARAKGISLTTIDTIIAAIAIGNDASLFTMDRDFAGIARIAPLRLYSF
jgi:predicted nucleic acid-binding protein